MTASRFTGVEERGPQGYVRVYYDADWNQYVCKFWCGKCRRAEGDYFTDDLDDAIETAKRMVSEERALP